MTAIGPYSQPYMVSQSGPEIRVKNSPSYDKSSIMGILNRTPIYSKFAKIVQLAQMDGVYDQPLANFTLFVVPDAYMSSNFIQSLDVGDARRIIKSSTMDKIIPSLLLKDSPATYFMTTDERNKLFVTNLYGKTMINNRISVLQTDISASNGMIHVIDDVIIPYI